MSLGITQKEDRGMGRTPLGIGALSTTVKISKGNDNHFK